MKLHRSLHGISAALTLFAVLAAGPAAARPQAGPLGAEAQQADEQFKRGRALYQSGKIHEAHEALKAAWSLKRSYDIAANLGTIELQLGMPRDAAEHFAYCIRTFAATGPKKQLEEAKRRFEDTRRQVGALAIRVNVDGAEVLVDGRSLGRTPLGDEVYVDPGARKVEARLAGYEPAAVTVQVVKGPAQVVTVALVAVVTVTPTAATSVAVGAGTPPVATTATAVPSATAPLPMARGPSTAVLVSGGALTGMALVMGTAFAVVSNGKASDATAKNLGLVKVGGPEACSTAPAAGCRDLTDLLKARATLAQASLGSFVGAGIMAAATVIYGLAAPGSERKAGVRAVPMVTGHGAGLSVDGSF